ncbi:unnamed protein product [Schistosoma spindalis]|nr:unnamed protein product [Schistosoma spindale]
MILERITGFEIYSLDSRDFGNRCYCMLYILNSTKAIWHVNINFLKNLVNSSHAASSKTSFTTMHTVRRGMQMENLSTEEAISINLFEPNLCIQKQYFQSLILL